MSPKIPPHNPTKWNDLTTPEKISRKTKDIGQEIGRGIANGVVMAPAMLLRKIFPDFPKVSWITNRKNDRDAARNSNISTNFLNDRLAKIAASANTKMEDQANIEQKTQGIFYLNVNIHNGSITEEMKSKAIEVTTNLTGIKDNSPFVVDLKSSFSSVYEFEKSLGKIINQNNLNIQLRDVQSAIGHAWAKNGLIDLSAEFN
jgi:hypothetical protein